MDHERRVVEKILSDNGHLDEFEVDPTERRVSDLWTEIFESLGCKVTREPFRTGLTVRPPKKSAEDKA